MSRTSINQQCPNCGLRHAGPFANCGHRPDDELPATPDARDASEVEALADVFRYVPLGRSRLEIARAVLASDWLAAREAAARAEERERIAQAIEAVAEAHLPWLRSDYEEAARVARGDS